MSNERSELELYHFGILGMKWGVRRYQNKDGSLTDAGRKRYGVLTNNYNKQVNRLNKEAEKLNKFDNRLQADRLKQQAKSLNQRAKFIEKGGNNAQPQQQKPNNDHQQNKQNDDRQQNKQNDRQQNRPNDDQQNRQNNNQFQQQNNQPRQNSYDDMSFLNKKPKDMTNSELQKYLDRERLLKQIDQLNEKPVKEVKKKKDGFIKMGIKYTGRQLLKFGDIMLTDIVNGGGLWAGDNALTAFGAGDYTSKNRGNKNKNKNKNNNKNNNNNKNRGFNNQRNGN